MLWLRAEHSHVPPESKEEGTPPKLKCELCGRVDFAYKFKRSKRFCSMACAKRYLPPSLFPGPAQGTGPCMPPAPCPIIPGALVFPAGPGQQCWMCRPGAGVQGVGWGP